MPFFAATALYILFLSAGLTIIYSSASFAVWVPTRKRDLERVFKLARLGPGEVFYDLGCGDGRVAAYAASRCRARAVGVELSAPMYLVCLARKARTRGELSFRLGNLFKADIKEADVVYLFGMEEKLAGKLKTKLERELMPGARVITYSFPISGWQPKIVDKPTGRDLPIYLYVL